MDTRLATNQIRLQQWAAIIHDRKESGLKVDDYCKLNNLSRNAYYYWLKKLRTAALESSEVTFAELSSVPQCISNESPSAPVAVSLGDATIYVSDSASSGLLEMVIEVLRRC